MAGSRVAQIADAGKFRPLFCEEVRQLGFRFRVADADAGRNLGFLQNRFLDGVAVIEQVDADSVQVEEHLIDAVRLFAFTIEQ